MGKPPAVKAPGKPAPARWPFDPLQPGGHEAVRLPEELERVQKQSGAGGQPKDKEGKR
ncbi:MAG TPA: hypothetical protein VE325_05605 [Burkholderiales bacterium]|jgi:hypothetical protein|nr:hypothetical protein [Burkholderiales bacterium]